MREYEDDKMRFIISRYRNQDEADPPCDEAIWTKIIRVDERTANHPAKIPMNHRLSNQEAMDWWHGDGANHRIENGHIKRDFIDCAWIVDLNTYGEFLAFYRKYGPLTIEPSILNRDYTEIVLEHD